MNAETRAALALVDAGLDPGQVDLALRMLDYVDTDTAETIGSKVAGLAEALPALFPQQRGGRRASGGQGSLPAAGGRPPLKVVETDHGDRSSLTPAERAQARFDATHGRPGGGSAA